VALTSVCGVPLDLGWRIQQGSAVWKSTDWTGCGKTQSAVIL